MTPARRQARARSSARRPGGALTESAEMASGLVGAGFTESAGVPRVWRERQTRRRTVPGAGSAGRTRRPYTLAMAIVDSRQLPVILRPGEDGFTAAECLVIPGCISQGRDREEAIRNIQEAIGLCISTDGLPTPGSD